MSMYVFQFSYIAQKPKGVGSSSNYHCFCIKYQRLIWTQEAICCVCICEMMAKSLPQTFPPFAVFLAVSA